MSDLHGVLIGFLNNLIIDFDFILDPKFSPLRARAEIIGSVWQEVKEQVLSTINTIEATNSVDLVDKFRKAGIPPTQIEWEMEEYNRIRQPFNKIATGLKNGETKIGHIGDGLRQATRPVSRWYNIILGSLSSVFPILGPVKEFDKAIAQLLSR